MEPKFDTADIDQSAMTFTLPQLAPENDDRPERLIRLERAAVNGDANAQFAIGEMYRTGTDIRQNFAEAFRWLQRAFENQNVESGFVIGTMYANGTGVEKNIATAIKWYRSSAARENAESMNALGNIYALGNGAPKDITMAAKWFRLAAKNNHANAQLIYALMLRDGRGIEKNRDAARSWAAKAIVGLSGTEKEAVAQKVFDELGPKNTYIRTPREAVQRTNAA